MAKTKRLFQVDNQPYTLDQILIRCPHLQRTAALKRLNCYAPTWAKLEAPLTPRHEVLARGRKIVDRTYKELTPNW